MAGVVSGRLYSRAPAEKCKLNYVYVTCLTHNMPIYNYVAHNGIVHRPMYTAYSIVSFSLVSVFAFLVVSVFSFSLVSVFAFLAVSA